MNPEDPHELMNPEDPIVGISRNLETPPATSATALPEPRCFDEAVGRATIEQLKIHIGIWKPQDIVKVYTAKVLQLLSLWVCDLLRKGGGCYGDLHI